jgi:gliding motility-associated-like protein
MKRITTLLLSTLLSFAAWASHVPGGNITYECLGNNQYAITLTLFEDCGSAFETNGNQTVQIANDCGIAGLTSVSVTNTIFQQEVSQLCIGQIGQSECNGGTLPGVYMHQWTGVVTLPADCDSWVFSYSSCCRNTSSNASSSSDNYYWESVLNSTTAPCNSSPVISGQPIPYNCVNQPVIYNFGVYEPDGNTLVYSLIPAATSATGTVSYTAGFSGASPINGVSIDPATGEITFTPTTTGNYIVAVLIEEYDANGNLVGSIIQDFQFEIINCAGNTNPAPPAGGLTGVTGTGIHTGGNNVQMCEGDNICFDVTFDDDVTDSVYLTSNIATLFPGGTFTQNTWIGTATATICFTVQSGANPFSVINVNAMDNSCPVVGVSSMSVGVTVVSSTYAGADETICLTNGVQLNANGGSNFNWTLISGDPITPGNFSCTNCQDPVANPAVTSVYEVTSNLAGGCTNTDQITVNVVPDFTYTMTQSSTTSCLNSDIQLEVTPDIPGNYAYTWSPGTFLSSTTIANPVVTPTSPGTLQYAVEIVSQDGCIKYDTIDITVAAAYSPDVTVTTNLTNIMCGDTIFFNADLGGGVPATCGASANTTCSAASSILTIGTGTTTNTTTSYPAPFGNFYWGAKHQYLFTAAELQAMGFVGGKITEISWPITTVSGAVNYPAYTISMGCTQVTDLTTTWETGLTEVYSPQNINVVTGWNTFVLTTAYEWDGISNLIIESCFNNSSYDDNCLSPYTVTPHVSVNYYRGDNSTVCSNANPFITTSSNRPNIRLKTCPTIPDPANFTFDWTPAGAGLSSMTDQNPYALPQVTTDFQLVVTDLNGGCTDTVITTIDVLCDTCQSPIPTLTDVTCFGGSDGEILATPFGINGPPFDVRLLDPVTLAILQQDAAVATNVTFSGLTAGDYLLRSYDTTGCWADTLVTINEPPLMVLSTTPDTIVCIGGTAVMTATAVGGNSANYTYNWTGLAGTTSTQNATPTAVSSYDVYALDPMGCSSDTLTINVNMYPPILTTIGLTDTVCPGFPGVVSVQANGGFGGNYNYSWSDEAGNVVGAQNVATVTPVASPSTYYVVVTDACETPAKIDSLNVYWYDEPQPSFTADVLNGCYPVAVNFTNTTDPTLVDQCYWDFGDGSTSNVCGVQNNIYTGVGTYDVSLTVTSSDGCVGDTTYLAYIESYDYPEAAFGIFPNPINVLEPTTTMYDSSSSDVTSFEWNFGEMGVLGSSTVQNPEFTFPDAEPENYDVELIVTNQYGCTDTIVNVVIMDGVYNFYVPTGFTPNDDGVNDTFFPKGEGVDVLEYEMLIFDRWGNIVFQSTETTKAWDGTKLGANCPQGVYVWKIFTKDQYTGTDHENIGNVTIVR